MIGMTKLLAATLLAVPLMMARTTLTSDGEKYLTEAKARITRIEKSVTEDVKDPAATQKSVDDLLASKRFLDRVLEEQPKNVEASALQKKADGLLKKLEPAMVKKAVAQRLIDIQDVLTTIDKDLALATRTDVQDESLRERFDMLRGMVKQVLEKEPANAEALKFRDQENSAWNKYRAQREASNKGGKP